MWMACSPGGRFFRSSWITTPDPVDLITADPAFSPPPFFSLTLTVLAELDSDNATTATVRKNRVRICRFMASVYASLRKNRQQQLQILRAASKAKAGESLCLVGRVYGQRLAVSSHPTARVAGCGLVLTAGCVMRIGCCAVIAGLLFVASASVSLSSESSGAATRSASTSFSSLASSSSFWRRTS